MSRLPAGLSQTWFSQQISTGKLSQKKNSLKLNKYSELTDSTFFLLTFLFYFSAETEMKVQRGDPPTLMS